MLGKFYGDVFDVELYCQMVDLICRLSEHAQKERLYGELESSLLLFKTPEQGMEEAYGHTLFFYIRCATLKERMKKG